MGMDLDAPYSDHKKACWLRHPFMFCFTAPEGIFHLLSVQPHTREVGAVRSARAG